MFNDCLVCNNLMSFWCFFTGKQYYQGNIFVFNTTRVLCFGQEAFCKPVSTEKDNRVSSF